MAAALNVFWISTVPNNKVFCQITQNCAQISQFNFPTVNWERKKKSTENYAYSSEHVLTVAQSEGHKKAMEKEELRPSGPLPGKDNRKWYD